jgi:hypothetical protein
MPTAAALSVAKIGDGKNRQNNGKNDQQFACHKMFLPRTGLGV